MYSILLDDNKYFTGEFSTIGKVNGGVDIDTLPPADNFDKMLCYKYDYHDVESVVPISSIDDNGDEIFTDTTVTSSVLEWIFDEEKYINILSKLKLLKINEINEICQKTIFSGIDIVMGETSAHFSFMMDDQSNIKALYDKVKDGAEYVPYHSDSELCRLFSAAEIIKLYTEMESFKTYNLSLCNYIKGYILTLTSIEDINIVTFDINSISQEYQIMFNVFMNSIIIN